LQVSARAGANVGFPSLPHLSSECYDGRLQLGVRISSLCLSLVSSMCNAACGRSVPELLAATLA
jgi:hypothetical protein